MDEKQQEQSIDEKQMADILKTQKPAAPKPAAPQPAAPQPAAPQPAAPQPAAPQPAAPQPAAQKPDFEELREEKKPGSLRDIDFLLDIPLTLTVELGRTKMLINDLLQLGQGSVLELEKLAGEPMEILVNDKLVARGEVVVVNEKFAIRLTDIISPTERLKQLK